MLSRLPPLQGNSYYSDRNDDMCGQEKIFNLFKRNELHYARRTSVIIVKWVCLSKWFSGRLVCPMVLFADLINMYVKAMGSLQSNANFNKRYLITGGFFDSNYMFLSKNDSIRTKFSCQRIHEGKGV